MSTDTVFSWDPRLPNLEARLAVARKLMPLSAVSYIEHLMYFRQVRHSEASTGSEDIWAFNVMADVMTGNPLPVKTAAQQPIEGLNQPPSNDELKSLVGFRPVLAQNENALRQEGWKTFGILKLMRPDNME